MKIYLIDKYERNHTVVSELKKVGYENVEIKHDTKFRINKTDVVITYDFDEDYENYQKVNNLIVVTKNLDKKFIWKIANNLSTKDIIFNNENDSYMVERIIKNLKEEK